MNHDSTLYTPAMPARVRAERGRFAHYRDAIALLPGGIAAPH
jgi:hypothetical protein